MKTLRNTLVLFLFMVVIFVLMFLIAPVEKGHYVPDRIEDGVLYDTDGDGDYYHWVEP